MAHESLQKRKTLVHPIWMIAALPAMVLLLFSDAGNNLAIVERFASGELSLWSWQGLAIGAALAAAPLGYASGVKQWMIAPTAVVVILGGILTLMSTQTDFKGKSVGAKKYQADFSALNAERSALIESLSPTDGSLPCKHQRWCDSAAKEKRLAQINTMTQFVDPTVDPLATPGGEFFAKALAVLRAFGVPAVVASLAHCLGLMFHKKRSVSHGDDPPGGKKRTTEYGWQDARGNGYTVPANSNPVTAEDVPERIQANSVTRPELQGFQHDSGVEGRAGHRFSDLRKSVLAGRVRPSVRQVRNYCGCRQDVAIRYLTAMADEGIITKKENGQYKLVDNVVPLRAKG